MAKRKLQTLSLQDKAKLIRAMKTNQTPISTHQWQCANHRLARKPENTVKNCEDLWNQETKCQVPWFSIFAVSNPMLRMKMNFTVGKVQLRTFSSGSKLTRLVKYSTVLYSTVKINVGFSPFPITRILDNSNFFPGPLEVRVIGNRL